MLLLMLTLVLGVLPPLLLAVLCRYLTLWRMPWLLSRYLRTATSLLETLRLGRSPLGQASHRCTRRVQIWCSPPTLQPGEGARGPRPLTTGWGSGAPHLLFDHGGRPGDPHLSFVRGWGSGA